MVRESAISACADACGIIALTLQEDRQERMTLTSKRPCVLFRAKKPDGIRNQTCRLSRCGDQDVGGFGLGSEQGVLYLPRQSGVEDVPGKWAAIEAKGADFLHRLLPLVVHLMVC